MHRQILEAEKGQHVDHINGRTLDNRRGNLRIATPQENQWNKSGYGHWSQFKGVCFNKRRGRWIAYIRADGKQRHLGTFANEIDAARAYDEAARDFFGEFARPNFPAA